MTAKANRQIIEIDEEKCDGCGQCILACAEGALALVGGKARLVGDVLCDGLGACIGECPRGALRVIERPAEEFDEKAVERRLAETRRDDSPEAECSGTPALPCGCPGSAARTLKPSPVRELSAADRPESTLGHWPVKLQLLGPGAPFLKGADLLLVADCAGVAHPALHSELLPGRAVAIGCPKLDDLDAHIERLAQILRGARPRSLTVVHMEVPCCFGFVRAAQIAMERSGVSIPISRKMIGRTGEVLEEEDF